MSSEFFPKSLRHRACIAIELNNSRTFEYIINQNRKLIYEREIKNQSDRNNRTLLIYAVQHNAWAVVHFILENFGDVVFDPIHTPIHEKLANLHVEAVNTVVNMENSRERENYFKRLDQAHRVSKAFQNLLEKVQANTHPPVIVLPDHGREAEMHIDVEAGSAQQVMR